TAVLESGDKVLSHGLEQGGHPSHGGSGSLTGKLFKIESYCVDKTSFLMKLGHIFWRISHISRDW
ncbi:MAG: hypothetical protein ACYS17_05420, partial [Planctomycetota bacterium]